jgi:hypothetical protein
MFAKVAEEQSKPTAARSKCFSIATVSHAVSGRPRPAAR